MEQNQKDRLELYVGAILELYLANLDGFIADCAAGEEISAGRMQMLGMMGQLVAQNKQILFFYNQNEQRTLSEKHHRWMRELTVESNDALNRIADAVSNMLIAE